jgi:hypothetical protein
MCSHIYGRVGFEVWSASGNWFWFVPYGHGGAIGAALTEAEAIREACAAIEAMAMRLASNTIGNRVQ